MIAAIMAENLELFVLEKEFSPVVWKENPNINNVLLPI
jgi:hypothetical protein